MTILFSIIAAFIVIPVIISLLMPKQPNPPTRDPENLGESVPNTKDGARVPVVFGRVLIKDAKVVWWGDNFAIPIKR